MEGRSSRADELLRIEVKRQKVLGKVQTMFAGKLDPKVVEEVLKAHNWDLQKSLELLKDLSKQTEVSVEVRNGRVHIKPMRNSRSVSRERGGEEVKAKGQGKNRNNKGSKNPLPLFSLAPELKRFHEDYRLTEMLKDPLDRVEGYARLGIRVLVLMRGVPGSGKSTLAKGLLAKLNLPREDHLYSADDYFLTGRGIYLFKPNEVGQAHEWAQGKVTASAARGVSPLFVDNTHTRLWEMKPYAVLAVENGYVLEILEPTTPWFADPDRLAKKNSHEVPKGVIKKMLERYYKQGISGREVLADLEVEYPADKTPPVTTDCRRAPSVSPNNKAQQNRKQQNKRSTTPSRVQNTPDGLQGTPHERNTSAKRSTTPNRTSAPNLSAAPNSNNNTTPPWYGPPGYFQGSEMFRAGNPPQRLPYWAYNGSQQPPPLLPLPNYFSHPLSRNMRPPVPLVPPRYVNTIRPPVELFPGPNPNPPCPPSSPAREIRSPSDIANVVSDFFSKNPQNGKHSKNLMDLMGLDLTPSLIDLSIPVEHKPLIQLEDPPITEYVLVTSDNDLLFQREHEGVPKTLEEFQGRNGGLSKTIDTNDPKEVERPTGPEEVRAPSEEPAQDKSGGTVTAGDRIVKVRSKSIDASALSQALSANDNFSDLMEFWESKKREREVQEASRTDGTELGDTREPPKPESPRAEESGKENESRGTTVEPLGGCPVSLGTREAEKQVGGGKELEPVSKEKSGVKKELYQIREAIKHNCLIEKLKKEEPSGSAAVGVLPSWAKPRKTTEEVEGEEARAGATALPPTPMPRVLGGNSAEKEEKRFLGAYPREAGREGGKRSPLGQNVWEVNPSAVEVRRKREESDPWPHSRTDWKDDEELLSLRLDPQLPKPQRSFSSTSSTVTHYKDFEALSKAENSEDASVDLKVMTGSCRGFVPRRPERFPAPLRAPVKLGLDKGVMTEDLHTSAVKKTKTAICSLARMFPDTNGDFLADLLKKCGDNVDWAADILLESGAKVSTVPDEEEESFKVEEEERVDPEILAQIEAIESAVKAQEEEEKRKRAEEEKEERKKKEEERKKKEEKRWAELEEADMKAREAAASFSTAAGGVTAGRTEEVKEEGEELEEEEEEEEMGLTVSKCLVQQLQAKFGSLIPPLGEAMEVKLPVGLARQLHCYVMDSLLQQLEAQEVLLQDMMNQDVMDDELLARKLQEEEASGPDLRQIMDMEKALAVHRASNRDKNLSETMAGRMARELLAKRFPKVDERVLKEILEDTGHSLYNASALLTSAGHTPLLNNEVELKEMSRGAVMLTREETIEQAKAYREVRSSLYERRKENFAKAQREFHQGNTSVASFYSHLARADMKQIEEANKLAATSFLSGDIGSVTTLDLHCLQVKEAVEVVDLFVDAHVRGLGREKQRSLYIITGWGAHSHNQVPRIRPAVAHRLTQRNIKYTMDKPGGLLKAEINHATALTCDE